MPPCSRLGFELPWTDPAPWEGGGSFPRVQHGLRLRKISETPPNQPNTKIPTYKQRNLKFLAQNIKFPKEAKMRKGQCLLSVCSSVLKTTSQNELCYAPLSPSTTCLL